MREKFWAFCLIVLISGCSSYQMEDMESWVKDPHYASYQQALDSLEHQYLQKQFSYMEYQKRKKALEDTYAREVKQREEKMRE